MPSEKIRFAAEVASAHSEMKSKHCCIIYDKRERTIIGEGVNRRLTLNGTKKFLSFHKTAVHSVHAEIAALIRAVAAAGSAIRFAKVYIHRRGGGCSKPCGPCMAAILQAGVRPENVEWSGM